MKITKNILLALIIVISNYTDILAQEVNKGQQEFNHFRLAFTIGHGYIPQANSNNPNFLIIPTIGLEFQYWFNQKWGISLKNDLEIANYTVEIEDDAGNKVVRENPLIISMPILFSPWENGITFIAGPGVEIEESENFSVFRLGIAYEFEFGNKWDFEPEVIYDLKNGRINSFTIAFGVGKRF